MVTDNENNQSELKGWNYHNFVINTLNYTEHLSRSNLTSGHILVGSFSLMLSGRCYVSPFTDVFVSLSFFFLQIYDQTIYYNFHIPLNPFGISHPTGFFFSSHLLPLCFVPSHHCVVWDVCVQGKLPWWDE